MTPSSQQPALDPLKRVFIPIEKYGVFRTSDGRLYLRLENGSMVRAMPKVRGKAARRADKRARRQARTGPASA